MTADEIIEKYLYTGVTMTELSLVSGWTVWELRLLLSDSWDDCIH